MICDAVFSDYNNDGWPDLVLTGEYMPITFLKNVKGSFVNDTQMSGIAGMKGSWNSITAGDFDNDGDIDYVVGNMGTNSFYKASEQYPTGIMAADFDHNGSYDAFPFVYLKDQQGKMQKYPAQNRDDLVKQMISLRTTYQNYKSFANATLDEMLSTYKPTSELTLTINYPYSAFLKNEGNGKFRLIPLPKEAQVSILNGFSTGDWDGDGNLDLAINGNDYGGEVSGGRYDALNGLILKGNGKGGFSPISILKSGFYIPGNGKSLVKLRQADGKTLLAASENRGPLRIFQSNYSSKNIAVNPDDASGIITFKNGKKRKIEFYYGNSFLSQSVRDIEVPKNASTIVLTNFKGVSRKVY